MDYIRVQVTVLQALSHDAFASLGPLLLSILLMHKPEVRSKITAYNLNWRCRMICCDRNTPLVLEQWYNGLHFFPSDLVVRAQGADQ